MSLLFLDGFDDGLNEKKYTSVSGGPLFGPSYGRNGSGLQLTMGRWLRKQVAPADEHATFIVGGAFRWIANPSFFNPEFLRFRSDNGVTSHMMIGRDPTTGQLMRGSAGGGIYNSGQSPYGPSLALNTWYYVEVKITLSDTVGAVTVKVNGTTAFSHTNIDTKGGGTKTVFDTVELVHDPNVNDKALHVDDFYICNGAGTDNNDFLGEIVVETLFPDGNGSQSDLVGSDGNSVDNYLLVDEAAVNTSDFVASSTVGQRDLYSLSNLAHTSGSVKGVQVGAYVAKDDTNPASYKLPVARSGSVDSGASKSITAAMGSYEYGSRVVEVDPVTGTALTISNVNGLEAGFEIA